MQKLFIMKLLLLTEFFFVMATCQSLKKMIGFYRIKVFVWKKTFLTNQNLIIRAIKIKNEVNKSDE